MSVNKVILIGRLGKDPEIRQTSGGQSVANFSVATDESYKNKDGDKVKKTEWHRIVIWGKLAEIAEEYLKKGSLVYLEGRIETNEWSDSEGIKRTDKNIVCSAMRMLGEVGGGAEKTTSKTKPATKTAAKKTKPVEPEEEYEPTDEDIPF